MVGLTLSKLGCARVGVHASLDALTTTSNLPAGSATLTICTVQKRLRVGLIY